MKLLLTIVFPLICNLNLAQASEYSCRNYLSLSSIMKVRVHRGGLDDSMTTVVELDGTIESLVNHISLFYGRKVNIKDVEVKYYSYDSRIDWDTCIIMVEGFVFGFSNANVFKPKKSEI